MYTISNSRYYRVRLPGFLSLTYSLQLGELKTPRRAAWQPGKANEMEVLDFPLPSQAESGDIGRVVRESIVIP